MKKIKFYI